jgi:hypothetical protein
MHAFLAKLRGEGVEVAPAVPIVVPTGSAIDRAIHWLIEPEDPSWPRAWVHLSGACIVAGLGLAGAACNWGLIRGAGKEMMRGGMVGPYESGDVFAAGVEAVEVLAGIALAEGAGFTHLLHMFGAKLSRGHLRTLAIIGGVMLALALGGEMVLSLLRDALMKDAAAIAARLMSDGAGAAAEKFSSAVTSLGAWPARAQMGFAAFFVLGTAVAAMPLETIFHSLRVIAFHPLGWLLMGVRAVCGGIGRGIARWREPKQEKQAAKAPVKRAGAGRARS